MFHPMQQMMGNNPMIQMMDMLRKSNNPMAVMEKMAGQNPQFRQVMDMTRGKTPQQMQSIVENMARQKGINLQEFLKNMGINMPL